MKTKPVTNIGWSIDDWGRSLSIGRTFVYQLILAGKIDTVKIGRRQIITTEPKAFLERCAEDPAAGVTS